MNSRVSGVCARVPQDASYAALHYAARDGHEAVVEALLARGANIEAIDKVPAGEGAAARRSRCRAT